MDRCAKCKHEGLETKDAELVRTVAGREFKAVVPSQICPQCGETYDDLGELARFDLSVAGELAREGPVSGESLRFMRKAVGLPAAELADLLGVTPEPVSRWEHGKLAFDRRTFALVGMLVLDRREGRSATADLLRDLGRERPAGDQPEGSGVRTC